MTLDFDDFAFRLQTRAFEVVRTAARRRERSFVKSTERTHGRTDGVATASIVGNRTSDDRADSDGRNMIECYRSRARKEKRTSKPLGARSLARSLELRSTNTAFLAVAERGATVGVLHKALLPAIQSRHSLLILLCSGGPSGRSVGRPAR